MEKEVREREEMANQRTVLGLGVDISKSKADICLKENSNVLESFIVTNDENGIAALHVRLDPYMKEDTFMIKAAMESTGNLWINMYGALEKKGIDISLANPLETKAIAEAKIKSDMIDAAVLADLARADLVSRCYVPEMNVREMRSLVRHMLDLARRNTQLKNMVHNLLDKYSMKYEGKKLFSKTGMEWLAFQRRQNKLRMVDSYMMNSYVILEEIEKTINQIMVDFEKQMAALAFNDERMDLLLGFAGIDYYGACFSSMKLAMSKGLAIQETGLVDRPCTFTASIRKCKVDWENNTTG
jgi:transposase